MPIRQHDNGLPVVEFDPGLEISPFVLFRRLSEGPSPLLVDVRSRPGPLTFEGALRWPGAGWEPPADGDVVLFDEDGREAPEIARELQAAGHPRVRILFGGLELYAFALDPEVVGEATFLVGRADD